jgi:hypothetical protein
LGEVLKDGENSISSDWEGRLSKGSLCGKGLLCPGRSKSGW